MPSTLRSAAAALFLSAALLVTGCTNEPPAYYSGSTTAGPVPLEAAQRAERFRTAGGEEAIQGVDSAGEAEGVPRVVVWSKDTESDAEHFEKFKPALIAFLKEKEGLKSPKGYLLDMYGGDGTLLHRLDARQSMP
ncbi:hypothetical protein [Streptomyces candidus]|uniref:Lipoprotein n=1 Tax=Streptomyces candidus TaxID=67283 RepID=A0A7X0HD77_9ACTN|nr:hypothetical protein [Streptomyces candidus]MBB6435455.1 hypothetical protein [Streptomyces candidus]GHH47409.1 hypothetical protein GCM10018773_40000 [Streptomyces candidus]